MAAFAIDFFGGDISAAAGATGRLAVGSFLPSDIVDNAQVLLRTASAHADVLSGVGVRFEVYTHDSPLMVDTDAACRAGRKLMDITLPMHAEAANAGAALGMIDVRISTLRVATRNRDRYASVVITAPANVGVTGSIQFKVFRPIRES